MSFSVAVDVAIGLFLAFAVIAGLASVLTELVARALGLRAAFLLRGLRELVGESRHDVRLAQARASYEAFRAVVRGTGAQGSRSAPSTPGTFTEALLGSPLLRGTGMQGTFADRPLVMLATPEGERVHSSPRRPTFALAPAAPGGAAGGGRARRTRVPEPAVLRRWRLLRSVPSYLPARRFADATLGLLAPASPQTDRLGALRASVERMDGGEMRESLQVLLDNADGDLATFRASLEAWYDDHMARVSGWYKRYVSKVTLAVGAVLVLLLNVNAVTIARDLYVDTDTRAAVVAVAAEAFDCPAPTPGSTPSGADGAQCLQQLQRQIAQAQEAGLPIGWTAEHRRALVWGWPLVLALVGWLLTLAALTPGARFWFDVVGRLGTFRSTGPPPPTR